MSQALLLEMLTWKRPYNSAEEKQFVHKYIVDPLQNNKSVSLTKEGPMENIIVSVGENSTDTIFSSHTDTVHFAGGKQTVLFDQEIGYAYKEDGECLGADDTAGIYIMLQMIQAEIPGVYIFHRGEERGGIGSKWMATNRQSWLKQFKRAIAFDRKDEVSVITYQRGRRCCSDEFANALAEALGPDWKKDTGGIYTDTAEYTHLIPECTNLSIGYYDQHTKNEMLNVEFTLALVEQAVRLDWESLPTVREAKYESYSWKDNSYQRNNTHPYSYSQQPSLLQSPIFDYENLTDEELQDLAVRSLESICRTDPAWAAAKIHSLLEAQTLQTVNESTSLELYVESLEDRIEDLETGLKRLERMLHEPAVFTSNRRSELTTSH